MTTAAVVAAGAAATAVMASAAVVAAAAITGVAAVTAAIGTTTAALTGGAVFLRLSPCGTGNAAIRRRNLAADQLLDVAQISALLMIAERDRDPARAGARGAADAV